LFRRKSGCSTGQKTFGIPFQVIPQKRKMLGITYRETILFHSISRKKTRWQFYLLEQETFVLNRFQNVAAENVKNSVRKDDF
jgi:hypothetical protein